MTIDLGLVIAVAMMVGLGAMFFSLGSAVIEAGRENDYLDHLPADENNDTKRGE